MTSPAKAAKIFCEEKQKLLVHGFADPHIINGQGTIGIEILQQLDRIDLVMIPIGGGGLISGIATFIKEANPKIKILGVQTAYYPAMRNKFLQAGLESETQSNRTIADGIAVKAPGDINYAIVQKYVDDIVVVDEDQISTAIFYLMENDHVVAEGAGAAATAASIYCDSPLLKNLTNQSNVISMVSGGNIDFHLLSKISSKVLKHKGRLMRIKVSIEDRPGNLSKIIQSLADANMNIVDIVHNRVFSSTHAYHVECTIDLETLNEEQQNSIIQKIKNDGYSVSREF